MKTTVNLLLAVALMATACTTGSKITSSEYSDDLYFMPGDAQPMAQKPVKQAKPVQQKSTVLMEVQENEQGKIVNNYVVPKGSRSDKNAYYFEEQPAYSDTISEYKDNKEQVTINNYYEGDEMDYTTRIRTFYDPFFYDPFWDPYWNFGFGYNWGWGGYYPYYGLGWGGYYPNYGFGWGGYYPYYGFGYGYGYGWGGYNPWYPPYFGGGGYYPDYGGSYYAGDVYVGKQNHTGKRGESNAVRYGANSNKSGSFNRPNGQVLGRNPDTSTGRLQNIGNIQNGAVSGNRTETGAGATGTRLSSNRGVNASQQAVEKTNVQGSRNLRGETISNLRRSNSVNNQGAANTNQSRSTARPATGGNEYTPTYNKPRMNTQPSYNSGTTRQYSSPQSGSSSAQTGRYARPQTSGSAVPGSTRTQQSSSYQRGSVGSSQSRSSGSEGSSTRSSSPSYSGSNSSSRSYSAPSYNNSSSGSFSGGSSSGTRGASSGGGFSGGGSSGSSGSSSGSSGRTR
jgi:hypothetical protein